MLEKKEAKELPELQFFKANEDVSKYKDSQLFKHEKDISDHTFPTDVADLICLTSYPRSGNTLLRSTLEKIMGIATGSDCDISKRLNVELMNLGLAGEGLCDHRVWLSKTHYPERYGKARAPCDRVILLVRSPLDAVVSLFNMTGSCSHDLSISDEDFEKHAELFNEWIE